MKIRLLLTILALQAFISPTPVWAVDDTTTACVSNNYMNMKKDSYLPGYFGGERLLKSSSELPSAAFYVVNIDGVGHLASRNPGSNPIRKQIYNQDKNLLVWEERISFYQPGKGFNKLTLEDAKKLFGKPDKRGDGKSVYYSFHVLTEPTDDEQQLYHVDLKFGIGDSIASYRIRGIGISDPKWINN